ncbi:hypothetical protein C1645_756938 [Glomus cerebriforme]|uniref:Uncharacterized protein n=1 Tax=Glomus cerebriforme TaxID=658196 RepID=A0A397TE92_9GLOM|nr:hypothetical protein C1645_756938 [Glomus cerebriforme]
MGIGISRESCPTFIFIFNLYSYTLFLTNSISLFLNPLVLSNLLVLSVLQLIKVCFLVFIYFFFIIFILYFVSY